MGNKEVEAISSKNWAGIDEDANKKHMNRSQFLNYCYWYWKEHYKKPTKVEIFTLFTLAIIIIVLLVGFNL